MNDRSTGENPHNSELRDATPETPWQELDELIRLVVESFEPIQPPHELWHRIEAEL